MYEWVQSHFMVLYTEVANGYEGLDLRSYEVLRIAFVR